MTERYCKVGENDASAEPARPLRVAPRRPTSIDTGEHPRSADAELELSRAQRRREGKAHAHRRAMEFRRAPPTLRGLPSRKLIRLQTQKEDHEELDHASRGRGARRSSSSGETPDKNRARHWSNDRDRTACHAAPPARRSLGWAFAAVAVVGAAAVWSSSGAPFDTTVTESLETATDDIGSQDSSSNAPHILLVTLDDAGWNDLGYQSEDLSCSAEDEGSHCSNPRTPSRRIWIRLLRPALSLPGCTGGIRARRRAAQPSARRAAHG